MNRILLLAALSLALQLHAADTQAVEAKFSIQRVMTAPPGGKRVCLSMFQFEFAGQSLSLDASNMETEKLGNADTTKPCTLYFSEDPATHAKTIQRVDQSGQTLYMRPDPALAPAPVPVSVPVARKD